MNRTSIDSKKEKNIEDKNSLHGRIQQSSVLEIERLEIEYVLEESSSFGFDIPKAGVKKPKLGATAPINTKKIETIT